jgi:zinc protease
MRISLPCEQFTLGNGLRIILHEDHRTPLIAVNVWYHVGSKDETPGRTGFAHLFEHLMFGGSENVPGGRFDELLEEVGATNNGSTSTDRTNYWELLPTHAAELALWLEADRMGGLLPAITQAQLDAQRDVVMNERRQTCDNRPYGLATETLLAALYPDSHPYHWPTIGSMADLAAATLDDVHDFCRTYYSPGNACLVIAGDLDPVAMRAAVERHFGDIPARPAMPHVQRDPVQLVQERGIVLEDDVTLPRLYMAWHSPPSFAPGDAELDVASIVLGQGRAARLHRSLVYDRQVAQSVTAYQDSALLGSTFHVTITARPDTPLRTLEDAVRAELERIASHGVAGHELERARNGTETALIDALQNVGDFGGRADQLNMYSFYTGTPDYVEQDLHRYQRITGDDVRDVVRRFLSRPAVVLSVVPRDRVDLAATVTA